MANNDRHVVINADDFGCNESANTAIMESFRHRWITQTTLMVNMPYADQAVGMAKREGYSDKIGLHFNITQGTPIGKLMSSTRFSGSDGNFNNLCGMPARMLLPYAKSDAQALEDEARRQIEKYMSYGLPLMHCDSHHHIHTRLPVAAVLLPLLKEYGFKTVRRPCNVLGVKYKHIALHRLRNALFDMMQRKCSLCSTDYFCSVDDKPPFGSVEYMVHPRMRKDGAIVDCTDYKNCDGALMKDVCSEIDAK